MTSSCRGRTLRRVVQWSLFSLVLSASLSACPREGVSPGPPESIDGLVPNENAYIGWITLDSAARRATRRYAQVEADSFFAPFDRLVRTEFGGSLQDVQTRYVAGETAGILRGSKQDTALELYHLEDGFDWPEWVDLPTAMVGPHLVLSEERAEPFFNSAQAWIQSRFGSDAMLENIQLEFSTARRVIITAGTWRWKPPRTHLHTVIVIVIR